MAEKFLMKGNEAVAEAAMRAGCRHFFGYPITPQTELAAYMAKNMPRRGGVFLQAESEIAAINMVYGAAGAGARVMTSSSSPGISLKQEGISYIAGADLPCVIVNMARGGPGLGSIQGSQSDYYQATRGGGHGDYHTLVYAPASVQELADMTALAFDKADEWRMPAMILGDGMLGQMMEPTEFSEPIAPESLPKKPWATDGTGMKRGKNIINSLYLVSEILEKMNVARYERYGKIIESEPLYEEIYAEDADIVIAAYGIAARIAYAAAEILRGEGVRVGILRPITLWPFPEKAFANRAKSAKAFLCVEMSMGQMIDDVRLAVNGEKPVYFYGRTGGMTVETDAIVKEVKRLCKEVENENYF